MGVQEVSGSKKMRDKAGQEIKQRKQRAKYWVAMTAMGALVAYSPVSTAARVLYAQDTRELAQAASRQQPIAGRRATQEFSIPRGPLSGVLAEFETLTGIRATLAREGIGDVESPGVSGNFTPDEALQRLLDGTGVVSSFTAADAVLLDLRGRDEQVMVTAEMPTMPLSSPKYTEPLRDVPQTITVIPKAVIEQQGATTLRDVLRNVPSLTVAAGEGGTPAGDNLTLRGFSARNDIFVDGVRDLGPQSRDPFNLEAVEVVSGPGSSFTGRGSTGGTINMVSKAPGTAPVYAGSVQLGTDHTKRVTGDVNVPLDGLGRGASFRLNALYHDSEVAGRNVVNYERWGLAPSLAFGLGTPTRATLSYFKLEQNNLSDYGIPWVPATNNALAAYRDKPAPVPRETFYGFRARDQEKMGSDLATVKVEHDFSDSLTLRTQVRFGDSTRDSIATPPRFANNNSTAINREMRSWITDDTVWDNQTDVKADFRTGSIEHALVSGLSLTREGNIRKTRTAPNSPTTLLNPNPDDVYTGVITTGPIVGDVTGDSLAVYGFDTAKLSPRWELTGGLRWEYFGVYGTSTTGAPVRRVDRMTSGRTALVFKPKANGSVYFSYGTSLNPSLEGLSYGAANTSIEPEKTYSVEAGSKWGLFQDRLLLSGAIFQTEKTNARTPGIDPGDPPQVLDGRQRVRGFELSATGNVTRRLGLFATYDMLDNRIVKSNNAAEVGKRLQNIPRNSFSAWTTYQSPWRISVGGGVRYIGKRFGNNSNTRFVEGYWLLEMMAAVQVNSHLDLRLNMFNLTDEYYFDRLGGGHLIPGPARSASITTNFRF
jgi:catecholate siderophore receptor